VSTPILAEIVRVTRSIPAVPLFVHLPVTDELDPRVKQRSFSRMPAVAERERYLQSFCANEGIQCLFLGITLWIKTGLAEKFGPDHQFL
jgi:hypothetical protein